MTRFRTLDHHTDDVLEKEDWLTLNNRILADVIALCQERGLPIEGDKGTLVKQLLDWKNTMPIPAPSTPRLVSMDDVHLRNPEQKNLIFQSLFYGEDPLEEIAYEDLEIGRKLGSGGFKDCYAGKYKGQGVAIGELRVANFSESDLQEMKHEINVLKQLRHENITGFFGVCANSNHLCIVTELCENGDLFDFTRKSTRPSFTQQLMYMHDVALGVAYLHTRRPSIIHRDLKSMNILITAGRRAKINDFGLARIRPRASDSIHTQCGTANWQAPEFWSSNPSYTEKVDVYACALIFWEILTWGELGYPYQIYREHQLYEAVRDRGMRPPLETLRKLPQTVIALIEEMWAKDPRKRPSMSRVVERLFEYLN